MVDSDRMQLFLDTLLPKQTLCINTNYLHIADVLRSKHIELMVDFVQFTIRDEDDGQFLEATCRN